MPYDTRDQALAVAQNMSCETGAYQRDDGKWMPCRSHEEYEAAKRYDADGYPKKKPRRRKDRKESRSEVEGEYGFRSEVQVAKVSETLGLVFGFAIVCTKNGKPYYDTQDDHIPEDSMLKAATDFMLHSRVGKEMHEGDECGTVVFAWPLTEEIAKSLDIETSQTGLLIALKPDPDVLAKFVSGEYTGFSIGGKRIEDEESG